MRNESTKPGAGGLGFRLDASAILVVDEFEEEKVEEYDQYGESSPEKGRQSSEGVAMFVQCDDVLQKRPKHTSIIVKPKQL